MSRLESCVLTGQVILNRYGPTIARLGHVRIVRNVSPRLLLSLAACTYHADRTGA